MNGDKKDKLGIDINNLDLTPIIEDKDNALINSKKKGGLYSSSDDNTINKGNEKKKVKPFSNVVENEKSNLTNNESLTVVEKGNLFSNTRIEVSYELNNVGDNSGKIENNVSKKNDLLYVFTISFLFCMSALMQFVILPFLFNTTNYNEGESIAYPYPILKYILYGFFVVFFIVIYFNYMRKNKNFKIIFLNIFILLFLIFLYVINFLYADILMYLYMVLLSICIKDIIIIGLVIYMILLFIMSFIAVAGGGAFWIIIAFPPLYPIFFISSYLSKNYILCGILLFFCCFFMIWFLIWSIIENNKQN